MERGFIIILLFLLVDCKPTAHKDLPPQDRTSDSSASHIGDHVAISSPSSSVSPPDSASLDSVSLWLDQLGALRTSFFSDLAAIVQVEKRDTMFLGFRVQLARRTSQLSHRSLENRSLSDFFLRHSGYIPLQELVQSKGFSIQREEFGGVVVEPDPQTLVHQFGELLTPALRQYLAIRAAHESEGFSINQSLLIDWDRLAERILVLDQFQALHPDFILASECRAWRSIYIRTYLTGLDHTPLFLTHDQRLDADVLSSYRRVVSDFPQSELAMLVAGYLDVLEQNDFRECQAVSDYLCAVSIESMIGVEAPIR